MRAGRCCGCEGGRAKRDEWPLTDTSTTCSPLGVLKVTLKALQDMRAAGRGAAGRTEEGRAAFRLCPAKRLVLSMVAMVWCGVVWCCGEGAVGFVYVSCGSC